MKRNTIIGIPSGEMLNCKDSDIRLMSSDRIVNYRIMYNGVYIDSFVFKDDKREYICDVISSNVRIGDNIEHYLYGYGVIEGILDVGWIIEFNGKKKYVTSMDLITDFNYRFIDSGENKDGLRDLEFTVFLKDNHVYNKFIYNMKNDRYGYRDKWKSISGFCDIIDRRRYITLAFEWSGSEEGYFFWKKIDNEWKSQID